MKIYVKTNRINEEKISYEITFEKEQSLKDKLDLETMIDTAIEAYAMRCEICEIDKNANGKPSEKQKEEIFSLIEDMKEKSEDFKSLLGLGKLERLTTLKPAKNVFYNED